MAILGEQMTKTLRFTAIVLLAALAGGCASGGPRKPPVGSLEPDKFLFERGTENLIRKRWLVSREYFRQLIDSYPQSQYRAHAKLGLGDTYLGERSGESYVLAINEFREFLNYYPTHERADYGQFKLAMSSFYQMRAAMRDQTETRDAIRELQVFVNRFPQSELIGEARTKLREARELWDLGRRIVEPVEGLSDHLATLVRLLDGVDDPRLEHFAMLAESRLRGVQHILGEWQSVEHRFDIPDVSFAATDLARAVKRAVEWARAASSTRGIELIVDDHRFPASCDAGSLEQSITHLLVAALHHSAGMPDLRVHLARQGGVAELEVSTRAVIPAGDLARILARFHRATCEDPVSRRSQKVAVRTIKGSVEAENGPLRVRSDSAHGTRFTLKMPLLADMHAPDTLPTVHLTEPTGAVEASEGARSEA